MAYGTIKVDTVTFTDAGIDKSVTLSGLVQNPTFSGNVTVTGTLSGVTVTGTTANFTSGNFTNISGGTHTITSGVFAAGSAASPSITFTGDLNTGIYSPGADQVAISTGGSGRLFVDAGGTLKVGTSADPTFGTFPRPAFYIKQLSDPNSSWGGIHIEAFGEQSVLGIGYDGNLQAFSLEASYRSTGGFRPIVFKTSSTERLRITSAGLVGVGTSSPSTTLSVAGGISGTAGANISGAGWGVLPYVANSLVIDNNAGEARFFATGANATTRGSFIFYNGETDGGAGAAMVIDTSGRVGVGTTSPARPLDVNGSVRLSSGSVIEFGGTVTNFITGDNSSNYLAFGTNSSERLRIDSSGRVGIGTSSPSQRLTVAGNILTTSAAGTDSFVNVSTVGVQNTYLGFNNSGSTNSNLVLNNYSYVGAGNAYGLQLLANGTPAVTIDASQRVGIGTTSPGATLDVAGSVKTSSDIGVTYQPTSGNIAAIRLGPASNQAAIGYNNDGNLDVCPRGSYSIVFKANEGGTERARIDSSGRLLIGTSTSTALSDGEEPFVQVKGTDSRGGLSLTRFSNDNQSCGLYIGKSRGASIGSNTIVASGDELGRITFSGSDGTDLNTQAASIKAEVDGTPGANDMPGSLVFSTTADGASSPTERMRIDNAGSLIYGTSTSPGADITSGTGFYYQISTGLFYVRSNGSPVAAFNRGGDDGTLVEFKQDQTTEGTISVSGTTVSYNGAHLSRWSQLPSGQERTEILRGSVLSNIDEMCEWGNEENEQLNRMKVSDVEGDKNVSGVFQAWDNDDDTYTNDFYCAMTGDFIIRIAPGVTVERGDLLMSAGDGTAKPQDDDIIRSKTIAKVTSINVSCTYDDGSYCVPCVLMAC